MPSTGPFVAIETSSSPGSVAVGTPPDDLREFAFPAGSDHGRGLIPALVTLTEAAGWPLAETTLVSVAIGPGPFTGLRVGVTTAKAIAWSTGCPVAAIPTATCLAAQAVAAGSPKGPVQVVFDAGRGELFVVTASPGRREHPTQAIGGNFMSLACKSLRLGVTACPTERPSPAQAWRWPTRCSLNCPTPDPTSGLPPQPTASRPHPPLPVSAWRQRNATSYSMRRQSNRSTCGPATPKRKRGECECCAQEGIGWDFPGSTIPGMNAVHPPGLHQVISEGTGS